MMAKKPDVAPGPGHIPSMRLLLKLLLAAAYGTAILVLL